jgi:hypothetical protein
MKSIFQGFAAVGMWIWAAVRHFESKQRDSGIDRLKVCDLALSVV